MEEAPNKPHFHVTAGLIWKNGKLLVSKRSPGSHLGGYWEFPGGKQEEGESLRACLEREVTEELGISISAKEAICSIDHEYNSKTITLHFFHCDYLDGEPKTLQSEEIRWVSLSELTQYTFPPPDRKLVATLSRFDREKDGSVKSIVKALRGT